MPGAPSKKTEPFAPTLRSVFSLDYRSLAAFRVGIAFLILCDLLNRAGDMTAHYTDEGAMPRSLAMTLCGDYWFFSLHYICGNFWFQSALFALAAIFALMLLVGYRTRFAAIMSWLFMVSLQNRNFIVLNGGDVFFRVLLFWSCLLPLGATFSLDRAFSEDSKTKDLTREESYFSAASVGLIFQIIWVYFFSGLLKSSSSSWNDGLALYFAFSAEVYASALGHSLIQYYGILKQLTPLVLKVEIFGAFLVLIPWKNSLFRCLGILTFWGFHITNMFLLAVGFFSPVGVVAWMNFIPSVVWRKIVKPWPDVTIYFDRECGVCKKMARVLQQLLAIPEERILPAQSNASIQREMEKKDSWVVAVGGERFYEFEGVLKVLSARLPGRIIAAILGLPPFFRIGTRFYRYFADHRPFFAEYFPDYHARKLVYGKSKIAQVFACGVILLTFAWNLSSLHPPVVQVPPFLSTVGFALRINQGWTMFENPLIADGWFVVPAVLKNGSHVDLFKGNGEGGPLDWKKPEVVADTFTTDRWRKYMLTLSSDAKDDQLREYGRFLCRKWNGEHSGEQLVKTFDVDYMRENVLPNGGKSPAQKIILWSHHCF